MSVENKLELLWNGANTLQSDLQVHKMLKTYYINTCRRLAINSVQIPKEKFATSQMCPYCGCFWQNSEYGLKLIPKQLKNSSKTKKLLGKLEQSKAATTGNVLKKRQKNRAKWLKKKIANHLAISCYQCRKRSILNLEQPKNKTREESVSEKIQIEKEAPVSNSGKKSKKQQQRIINSSILPSLTQSKSKKEKIENKSQNISKSKSKKQPNTDASNKVISKTQKHNSLLQLAALLQKQSKNDGKSSAQKRLESFLK